jgi:hypothetical protein
LQSIAHTFQSLKFCDHALAIHASGHGPRLLFACRRFVIKIVASFAPKFCDAMPKLLNERGIRDRDLDRSKDVEPQGRNRNPPFIGPATAG